MQVDLTFLDALLQANVPEAAARAAAESLSREIDRRYAIHERALMTKGDGEQIRSDLYKINADMHKSMNELTWKVGGMMVALAAVLVAALKVSPMH
jgi:hypothetical protein